jgi:hypothetical protein
MMENRGYASFSYMVSVRYIELGLVSSHCLAFGELYYALGLC